MRDTFTRDTFTALAQACRTWIIPTGPGAPITPDQLVTALRSAEAATTGPEQQLWAQAAVQADAAAWLCGDGPTARMLWTKALTLAQQADAQHQHEEFR